MAQRAGEPEGGGLEGPYDEGFAIDKQPQKAAQQEILEFEVERVEQVYKSVTRTP
jgi:hypothetical protein